LPQNRREAVALADQLDALARALREWPLEAWRAVASEPVTETGGVFQRLVASTAPLALKSVPRQRALESAEAVADVLRVLWPVVPASETHAEKPELIGAVG
jgi:hypothetical protein